MVVPAPMRKSERMRAQSLRSNRRRMCPFHSRFILGLLTEKPERAGHRITWKEVGGRSRVTLWPAIARVALKASPLEASEASVIVGPGAAIGRAPWGRPGAIAAATSS